MSYVNVPIVYRLLMLRSVTRGLRMSKLRLSSEAVSQLSVIRQQISDIRTETRTFLEKQDRELLKLDRAIKDICGQKREHSTADNVLDNGDIGAEFDDDPFSYDSDGASAVKKMKTESGSHDDDQMRGQRFRLEDGYVQVFTDGACPDNGKVGARAGIGVWWNHGHKLNISKRVVGNKQTNNVAEIQAICFALTQTNASKIKKIQLNTDSMFVINSVTQWMEGWKRKGWKTSTGQDVKNKDDFMQLDKILQDCKRNGVDIKWNHVKGHANIEGNEEADRLAVLGAQSNI